MKSSIEAQPSEDSIQEQVSAKIPRQFAPLLRNEWYVIAARGDVEPSLKAIKVLGDPLVYYRTQAGEPVVLSDRCAHRFYPLSKSVLEGDGIRCGYHGFKYGHNGKCIDIPGDFGKPNFGVRRYPAVERGPYLWVWMGDVDLADESRIPLEDIPADWTMTGGYVLNPCNYMLVIENLFDLTHVLFLHGPGIVDDSYSNTLPTALDIEGGIGTRRVIENTTAFAGTDRQAKRIDESVMRTPALHDTTVTWTAIDDSPEPLRPSTTRSYHALTPCDLTSTHQFWTFMIDAPMASELEEQGRNLQENVFPQDLEAVAAQMDAIMGSGGDELREHRLAADKFAMRMHRILVRRGAEEEAAKNAKAGR